MKKWIVSLMCLALTAGCLTACGKGGVESSSASDSKTTSSSDTVAESSDAAEESSEAVEEADPWSVIPEEYSLPLATEETTITIGIFQYANVTDYDDNGLTNWLEEIVPISLNMGQILWTDPFITSLNIRKVPAPIAPIS